jgi:hypothetical protein
MQLVLLDWTYEHAHDSFSLAELTTLFGQQVLCSWICCRRYADALFRQCISVVLYADGYCTLVRVLAQ